MDKMRMESVDMTAQNIDKIGALFPNCITETIGEDGKMKKAINFELLRQMLSGDVLEGDEAYEFTWVGKKAAIVEANKPIRKTLRPCKEESVNWDTTENLYIEGDNLEVLKLLQESYLGKVKMIYIDPPYNTGSDFIYRDDFKQSADEYEDDLGVYDESRNRMFKNTDSNGRFHSDWCSMIYSRLMLARNLLTDDGVIFISIDDNEVENLKKVCSEVFGERNFVAIINWKGRGGRQDSKYYAAVHEYIICYAKNKDNFAAGEEIKNNDVYPKFDSEKGRFYKTQLLRKWGSIISESERLAELSNNVLYLSKIEKQTILTDKKRFNVSEQIRLAVALLDQKLSEKQLEIIFDSKEFFTDGNEEMMKQVWINLLDNAIKFSPIGGKITILAKQTDGKLSIQISNQGEKIPPETKEHIFDKFYQGDLSHATAGNGLGLAIVKKIIDLHGGHISVFSSDKGSTFEVILNNK